MKTISCCVAAAAVVSLNGCSEQAVKRAGFETLHNISDMNNDIDPKYEPGPRPSIEVYEQQREQILRDQQPGAPAPVIPLQPVQPVPP